MGMGSRSIHDSWIKISRKYKTRNKNSPYPLHAPYSLLPAPLSVWYSPEEKIIIQASNIVFILSLQNYPIKATGGEMSVKFQSLYRTKLTQFARNLQCKAVSMLMHSQTRLNAYVQDVSKDSSYCFGSAAWFCLGLCSKDTRLSQHHWWNPHCFGWSTSKPQKWKAFQLLSQFASDLDCFDSELTTWRERWAMIY